MSELSTEPEGVAPRFVDGSLMVPLTTEVLTAHRKLVTRVHSNATDGIVVHMDVRRDSWWRVLGLKHHTKVHWADIRTIDIHELSVAQRSIRYRLTYGDGWYADADGKRRYFALQPHLQGIDLNRRCTLVAIRTSVLLLVMAGVGVRFVSWLMAAIFHFEVSKSSLDRWVKECADQLPDAAGMAQALHSKQAITEAHFDEIFAKGQRPKRCSLVLRDEHGRIFAVREVEQRDEATVSAFLEDVKKWGIVPHTFYVDGCDAYRAAISKVFPNAAIQYDYFHVIQNIWKKLWSAIVCRRKTLKDRSQEVGTPAYAKRLAALAQRIWENRWVFLKRDENMSEEERAAMVELMEADKPLATVRGFAEEVWKLFEESKTQDQAREALAALSLRPEVENGSVFEKVTKFLHSRFDDMTAFLRHPRVKRNSLAETGIRALRRLERGHDGFRGAAGLDRYLRLYQAIKYCGWAVHRSTHDLGLPQQPERAAG